MWEYREKFMEGMKEHHVFVLVGETGSGKTTQVIKVMVTCNLNTLSFELHSRLKTLYLGS